MDGSVKEEIAEDFGEKVREAKVGKEFNELVMPDSVECTTDVSRYH